jgi:hypothetical protein
MMYQPVVQHLQGRFEYQGKTHMLIRILSGVLIALTTVYGYVTSQRAITAVLRNTSDRGSTSSGYLVGGEGTKCEGGGPIACKGGGSSSNSVYPLRKSLSLSMTALDQRDLDSTI